MTEPCGCDFSQENETLLCELHWDEFMAWFEEGLDDD